MTLSSKLESQPFVLLRLVERRFAVSPSRVAELVAPSRIHFFPHRSANIEGVILRRGRIVPIRDISEELFGTPVVSRRYYLIASWGVGQQKEWVALPVTGECELITGEMIPAKAYDEFHVSGWVSHGGDEVQVLNLDALNPAEKAAEMDAEALAAEEVRP